MIISRHFYVKSQGITTPIINLNDIPGSTGRLDIIARCINAALWCSFNIRRDVTFHTVLHGKPNPPIYLRLEGRLLKKMSPDERNVVIFIKKAIERMGTTCEMESTPGFFSSKKDFKYIVEQNKDKNLYLLDENGTHLSSIDIGKNPFFFLGDNKDLETWEKNILVEHGANIVSLGKVPYLSSHCIAILNWYMDSI